MIIVDEAFPTMAGELTFVRKEYGYYDAICMDGPFEVDGITYNQDDADHEIRPMIQLFPDGGGHTVAARWCPVPVTEAEMREFIHTGLLDGAWHG